MSRQMINSFFQISIFVFSLLALLSCSDEDIITSQDANLSPGTHLVVYKIDGTSGRQVKIEWVDTNALLVLETVLMPTTREATKKSGDWIGLKVEYKPGAGAAFAEIIPKILVDGKIWANGYNAGNFLEVVLGDTL